MKWAVYTPLGPLDAEIVRAADLIDSVAAHSDKLEWVVLVDDGSERREIASRVAVPPSTALTVLRNPRNGAGHGLRGGVCVSTLIALDYVTRSTDADFVLKLDTDSLLVGSFENRMADALAAYPDAGMFGVIGDSAGRPRTYSFMQRNRLLFDAFLTVGTAYSRLTAQEQNTLGDWGIIGEAAFERFLRAREVLESADRRGYRKAEYCQGGGYVATRRLLDAMAARDAFADPMLWCCLDINEDVMMGLFCAAAGLGLYDLSGTDEIFTVEGPLPYSPQQLRDMNTSVIHSIKGEREQQYRTFFRAQRSAMRNARAGTPA